MKDNRSTCIANSVVAIIIAVLISLVSLACIMEFMFGSFIDISIACASIITLVIAVKVLVNAIIVLSSLSNEVKSINKLLSLIKTLKILAIALNMICIWISIIGADGIEGLILTSIIFTVIVIVNEIRTKDKYIKILNLKIREIESKDKD